MPLPSKFVHYAIKAGLKRGWTARVAVEGTAAHVRPTKHLPTLIDDATAAELTEVTFYDDFRTIGSITFAPYRPGIAAIRDYSRVPAIAAIHDELKDIAGER